MENASKALIIAGAILLSILIIGLGMVIFNQAKDALSNTGMDQQKISAFNDKFEAYEGDINGTKVKALLDLVKNNNAVVEAESKIEVEVNGIDGVTIATNKKYDQAEIAKAKNGFKPGKTYNVVFGYNTSGEYKGYINKVTITKPGSNS